MEVTSQPQVRPTMEKGVHMVSLSRGADYIATRTAGSRFVLKFHRGEHKIAYS